MAVDAVRPSRTRLPPLPQRVAAGVRCTDSGLAVESDSRGRILLRGVTAPSDGAGAELSLAFEGTRVSACLRPGTSAAAAVALLEKALPPGYRLSVAEEVSGEIVIELIRSPNAPPPRNGARHDVDAPAFTDAVVG